MRCVYGDARMPPAGIGSSDGGTDTRTNRTRELIIARSRKGAALEAQPCRLVGARFDLRKQRTRLRRRSSALQIVRKRLWLCGPSPGVCVSRSATMALDAKIRAKATVRA